MAQALSVAVLFSHLSPMAPSSRSHCSLKKHAQFWNNISCTLCSWQFVLAALKWNLFACTPFPSQVRSVPSPNLLRSLITAALVFVSLANLDLLSGQWYLYWCLDCNNCLWDSGEKRYGISFYWGDGSIDLLLGRKIKDNKDSTRCVLRRGFVGEVMNAHQYFLHCTLGQQGMRES